MKAITLLIPALFLALAGCAAASGGGPAASSGPDPIAQVAQFTVADLTAADADAVANNDAISHACYPALIQFVHSLPSSNAGTTVLGAFSAFQKARDLRNAVSAGVPLYLTMGCGPLYSQVHGDLLKFLAGGFTP